MTLHPLATSHPSIQTDVSLHLLENNWIAPPPRVANPQPLPLCSRLSFHLFNTSDSSTSLPMITLAKPVLQHITPRGNTGVWKWHCSLQKTKVFNTSKETLYLYTQPLFWKQSACFLRWQIWTTWHFRNPIASQQHMIH